MGRSLKDPNFGLPTRNGDEGKTVLSRSALCIFAFVQISGGRVTSEKAIRIPSSSSSSPPPLSPSFASLPPVPRWPRWPSRQTASPWEFPLLPTPTAPPRMEPQMDFTLWAPIPLRPGATVSIFLSTIFLPRQR